MDEFLKSAPQLCQSMIKTAANAITCIDTHEQESQEILNDLRINLEKYCRNIEKHKKINELSEEILEVPEENRASLLDNFCENINSFEPNVVNSEYLKEFDDRVAALMKNSGQQTNNDDSVSAGDELQIAQNNINLICPISKSKMTEPMQNKICGHVYDKSSVVSLLEMSQNTRCPIVGCSNRQYLSLQHLKCDIVTQMCVETNNE
ncbi:hypothetical protein PV327_005424 [Microctonus hyperodae]|uniref:E3 SUMO-protein ligase NSE2 n=1 Tax=Microctonus hyperodae TaxID=165561 RepID=A0AA39KZN4_MICHY|nr:hypothetical protein PV327_005424 [Microctonus hyperodae]